MKKFIVTSLLLVASFLLSSCQGGGYVDQYGQPVSPLVAMRAMQNCRSPMPSMGYRRPPPIQERGGVRSVTGYRPYYTSDGYPLMQGTSPTGHTFYRDPTGRGYQDLSDGGPNRSGRLVYVYY